MYLNIKTTILDASSDVTESGQNHFGEHGPLGVNLQRRQCLQSNIYRRN